MESGSAEQLVRRLVAAWERFDADEMIELTTPDVDFTLPRNVLEGGSYRGHDDIRRMAEDVRAMWGSMTIDVVDLRLRKGTAMVRVRVTTAPRAQTPPADYVAVYVMELRDGLVARSRVYLDPEEGAAAFETASGTPSKEE